MTREQYERLTLEELNEAVCDSKCEEAAVINNGGRQEQIDYLMSRELIINGHPVGSAFYCPICNPGGGKQ